MGAVSTTQGQPYVTKWPDADRNINTREVARPALASCYFGIFNKVDIHDQRRQHELGLEMKWVAKSEHAGKFRIATTIFGMVVIDTMLGLKGQSHLGHSFRSMTTKDFAEFLATEMVDNELDGAVSRPTLGRRSLTTAATSSEAANTSTLHPLVPVGKYASGMPAQLHCVMCGKKTTTVCNGDGCRSMAICKTSKRSCYEDHCFGEGPSPKKGGGGSPQEKSNLDVDHGLFKK